MKVYKFGGTSVGTPQQMRKVARLIQLDQEEKIVVLSAVSGTTNQLIAIADTIEYGDQDAAGRMIDNLKGSYISFVEELLTEKNLIELALQFIHSKFTEFQTMKVNRIPRIDKVLPAQGEILSTRLFKYLLDELNVSSNLLSAFDFMRIDQNDEPVVSVIREKLTPLIHSEIPIHITQGYICLDQEERINNLQRGGSDYTASLIGAAVNATEVQIWTDIDGMHNNDPRIVEGTFPISHLSFDEAAELAYFGAKILHPSTILPAHKYDIPVRLKSTMNENANGTLISHQSEKGKVKAIAAKDGITAIKIKSSRMLLAYGFLRRIFEIFENHRTPIDMITTSEVAVSLTIDNDRRLSKVLEELKSFGFVEVDKDQSIICIVGDRITEEQGILAKIFASMNEIPIRMVSYGGSRFNVSLLIDSQYKSKVLNRLNDQLF